MPAIADIGPYRFFFYSAEGKEPPHIHVRRDSATAKYWLTPVRLARSRQLKSHELRAIAALVAENRGRFLEAWNEHFSN
jgi:hypothetical protein